jgi:hypothetical protein
MKFLMSAVLVILAVVAVVVVAGLVWFGTIWIAYQIKLGWVEVPVHYRLSFSVEVGGVSYEGSTVAQITYRQIPYWQTLTEPGFASLYKGQAGCVKLPDEKMICLMPGAKTMAFGQSFHSVGGIASQLLSVDGSPTGPKEKWRLIGARNAETVAGSSDIPIDLLPPMIVLDDAAHPSSAHLFDPERPEKTLGAGSRFLVAQIAVTNDSVSHDIETVLPWLADPGIPQILSEPGDPFRQENRGYPLFKALLLRFRQPSHSYCRLPFIAQSRHADAVASCPLLRDQRTWLGHGSKSENDPGCVKTQKVETRRK